MRHYQRGIATTVILLFFLLAAVAIASGAFIFFQKQQQLKSINSFEDCAKYYPVMESYPAQCNTPDGRHFVQELSEEEKEKLKPPAEASGADETANWKTYTNTKYGYELKYPSDWTFEEHQEYDSTSLYPPRLSEDVWDRIQKEFPLTSQPEIVVEVIEKPFFLPGSENLYGLYSIKPTLIKVGDKEGVYSLATCAPSCWIEFDYPYDNGNKTLRLSLNSIGEENLSMINKEFDVDIRDISEDLFKEIMNTLKISK